MNFRSLKSIIDENKDNIISLRHFKKIKKFLVDQGVENFSEEELFIEMGNIKPSCPGYKFISYSVGYRACYKGCECYKKSLSDKIHNIKANYTDLKKSDILDKRIKTVKEIYQVENIFQLESTKDKSKSTKSERYDDPTFNNREKSRVTSLDRYGSNNPAQAVSIKKKIFDTNLERYGSISPLSSDIIKEKIKSSLIERYGVDHPMKSSTIREKIKQTNIKRYGVENPSQKNYSADAIEFLNDEVKFKNLLETKSVFELSKEYSISLTPIYDRIKSYKLDSFVMSGFQRSVVSFIQEIYFNEIQTNNKKILDGLELDIFIPEFNLGIECNGTYWHSELNGKDRNYHLNKTIECKKKNIFLLHIWEHDWYNKTDIIKSIIRHKLGLSKKLYARKGTVEVISSKASADFIENNHIQSAGTHAPVSIALKIDNEIVSAMTFGKSRFNKNFQWELLRFCNKAGYSVTGSASRLFSYFIKNYKPETIITYSDSSLMSGNLYSMLGFVYNSYSRPSYFYTKDYKVVFHRTKFQKYKLPNLLDNFDKEKTEWQNMVNNGYDRIWNCGNDVWSWKLKV